MHIIIPMSGMGNRFIEAGYSIPKPLITVEGKPIIEHVINLFPGESKFTFICNSLHLRETNMRVILSEICPSGNILEIPNHKKGPVFAISQIYEWIDDDEEVIVNYCDFGTFWNYNDFLNHTRNRNADGAIPAYKGFHPHMLGSTNYAFIKDHKQWLLEIKEKEPFTDNRMQEYASNGTYYFKKGKFIKKYFNVLLNSNLHVNGEYYVSLIYNLLIKESLKVSIYEIQHMLQWGTPDDLEEFNRWSNLFNSFIKKNVKLSLINTIGLMPLAGYGSRFTKEGYAIPKPLIEVSGKPMIIQATNSLPKCSEYRFLCLSDHNKKFNLSEILNITFKNPKIITLNKVTDGQAVTSNLGLFAEDEEKSLFIGATDNGMIYNQKKLNDLISDASTDAIVFTFKNHISAKNNPEMYGWVKTKGDRVIEVSVKKPISKNPENDQAIVGTFYFKKTKIFKEGFNQLKINNNKINNEFYIDSLMHELIQLGYNVKFFQVDHYICWGTPNDYKTFKYWQSYFHKSKSHAYSLFKDENVGEEYIHLLIQEYTNFKQENV